MNIENVGNV